MKTEFSKTLPKMLPDVVCWQWFVAGAQDADATVEPARPVCISIFPARKTASYGARVERPNTPSDASLPALSDREVMMRTNFGTQDQR
jgi:hypothetical protein